MAYAIHAFIETHWIRDTGAVTRMGNMALAVFIAGLKAVGARRAGKL
jgi:hypothetical protein